MNHISFYKTILVLGAAESGIGAALLAKQKGHEVFVLDEKEIRIDRKKELDEVQIPFAEQGNGVEEILNYNLVIKSPGIAENNVLIQKIRQANIPVMSEIDFAYCYKQDAKIIAITGTNGKTTTTTLIHHIFLTAQFNAALVGNVGYSFAKQIALAPKPYYIVEVSSFQLDDIHFFQPDVAVLLNITEDHLERYAYSFVNYAVAKFAIAKYQSQDNFFIYNEDDEMITKHLQQFKLSAQLIPFTMHDQSFKKALSKTLPALDTTGIPTDMDLYSLPLRGKHNAYNMLAATLSAKVMGVRSHTIRQALQSFKNLPHRMESVALIRGVEYINDSKATNINSTWYALESMTKPTILILGGIDKGNDYAFIKSLVQEKVKAIICLGKDNAKIVDFFSDTLPVYDMDNIKSVLTKAYQISQQGDVVLLSPACASFDLFQNFEDRGNQFKNAVNEL